MSIIIQILLLIVGFVCLIKGADIFVDGSSELARRFKVPGLIIGLTIVAVGTSLPELVTSIIAARKGETGMAIGNVIGSNIFNLLFILGVSALINPVAVNMASVYDMIILIVVSIIGFVFALSSKKINRFEGIIMVLIYVADVVFAILR